MIDWQALGTWFTGIAIAVFAYLTWKLSQRQHQVLYSTELEGYSRYDPPKVGARVLTLPREDHGLVYDGIAWEVSVSNPGALPIIVKNTIVRIRSTRTRESVSLWPGPYCTVFTGASKTSEEAKQAFTVTAGRAFVRSIIIHEPQVQAALDTIARGGREFSLEAVFFWTAVGRGKEQQTIIKSQEFALSGSEPFGRSVVD